jgi:predicted nuclease of restriction endonuclease-like (RecB) superfamily
MKKNVDNQEASSFHMGNCNAATLVSHMKRHLWLMVYMTQHLRFNSNEIFLTADFYATCCRDNSVSMETVKKYIKEMVYTGVLIKLKYDKVVLHPDTFFRGNRSNIKKVYAMRNFMSLEFVKKRYDLMAKEMKMSLVQAKAKKAKMKVLKNAAE